MTPLISVTEAARELAVSPTTVNNWLWAGKLPCVHQANGIRAIRREDLENTGRVLAQRAQAWRERRAVAEQPPPTPSLVQRRAKLKAAIAAILGKN